MAKYEILAAEMSRMLNDLDQFVEKEALCYLGKVRIKENVEIYF